MWKASQVLAKNKLLFAFVTFVFVHIFMFSGSDPTAQPAHQPRAVGLTKALWSTYTLYDVAINGWCKCEFQYNLRFDRKGLNKTRRLGATRVVIRRLDGNRLFESHAQGLILRLELGISNPNKLTLTTEMAL